MTILLKILLIMLIKCNITYNKLYLQFVTLLIIVNKKLASWIAKEEAGLCSLISKVI